MVQTNTIVAYGADEITFDDNVLISGNLNITGHISAKNINPFWTGGKVNGTNLGVLSVVGRYGYTVTRSTTYPIGVYYIKFNTEHSNANNVISLTTQATGFCRVWDGNIPTAAGLYDVTSTINNILTDLKCYFPVIA